MGTEREWFGSQASRLGCLHHHHGSTPLGDLWSNFSGSIDPDMERMDGSPAPYLCTVPKSFCLLWINRSGQRKKERKKDYALTGHTGCRIRPHLCTVPKSFCLIWILIESRRMNIEFISPEPCRLMNASACAGSSGRHFSTPCIQIHIVNPW